jgi:hypothetical protein
LAEDCPNFDKAFSASQYGKVLGVWFNTADLTWSYPAEKTEKLLYAAGKFFSKGKVSLLQMQKLMGRINDVGLLCPFLKAFKGPLNEILGELQRNPGLEMYPSEQCKKDLLVWVAFVQEIEKWKPIPHRPMAPPPSGTFPSPLTQQGSQNGEGQVAKWGWVVLVSGWRGR